MTWKRVKITFEGASAPFIYISATEEKRKPRTIEKGFKMVVETSYHLTRWTAENDLNQ